MQRNVVISSLASMDIQRYSVIKIKVLILLILLTGTAVSQSIIGGDFQINKDLSELRDPGGQLSNGLNVSPSTGLFFQYLFSDQMVLRMGFHVKNYSESIRFKPISGGGSSSFMAGQVQLMAGYQLVNKKGNVFFTPFVGSHVVLMSTGNSLSAGASASPDGSFEYVSESIYDQPLGFALNASLLIEKRIKKIWRIGVFIQYAKGLTPLRTQTIIYSVNGSAPVQASNNSTGDYLTIPGFRICVELNSKE